MSTTRVVVIFVALSLFAWCQDADQQQLPVSLTSDLPSVVVGENTISNQLSLGFVVTGVYDDNVFLARSEHQSDWRYLATPSIRLTETRPRYDWNLQYQAGVSGYHSLPMGTQSSHEFSGMLELKPTRRFRLRMRQDYIRSIDPFSAIHNSLPNLGIVNSPNQTVLSSAAIRNSLTSLAEIEYATSPHGKLGFSGTFAKADYSDVLDSTNPLNPVAGNTVHGSAYYSHQMTAGSSIGLQYVLEDMTYKKSPNRVRTHSMLLFTTIGFNSHSSLTLYAGPQYAHTKGLATTEEESAPALFSKQEWKPYFGGVYSWVGSRTDVNLSASRRVNDGGGVLHASLETTAGFSAGRKLTRRWYGGMGVTLANNQSTGLFASEGRLRTAIGDVTIERRLTDSFSLAATYDRVYQDGTGTYLTVGNQNRVQFSLQYVMTRPLGK